MSVNRSPLKVLFVGESWIKHTIHMKGFDQFHSTEYEEGAGYFLGCLADAGVDVTYVRGHEVSLRFPRTTEELDEFDVVVISDIGSNSFLLPDETFLRSERSPNRLGLVADFVRRGGGLSGGMDIEDAITMEYGGGGDNDGPRILLLVHRDT